jgi:exosortase C (VPDSG-CTERM-specific)
MREISERQPFVKPGEGAGSFFEGNWRFWAATIALLLCFGTALGRLVSFAWNSELYSYILLIPFVSCFLVWIRGRSLHRPSAPARGWSATFAAAGLAALGLYWLLENSGSILPADDRLTFTTLSFLLLFYGICCFFFGRQALRQRTFALGLLVFIVPIPAGAMRMVEAFLQQGSALVAAGFFWVTGTTFSSQKLMFHLPGISFQVAPECSGIHSTLVLLITSLIAGYFFLRSPARRTVLALMVIPLALLRNGLRIFTIGQLCIHVGPEMIDSPFHHHWAGPLFFGLSLVPFVLLLYVLQERGRTGRGESNADDSLGHPEVQG